MSSEGDLNARAATGETMVPGGTGGKSVEAQQNLAEGRSRGEQVRSEEPGKKDGSTISEMSGGDAAAMAGGDVDDGKLTSYLAS